MPDVAVATRKRFELLGPPGAPVVAALGGISASRHARSWWPRVVSDGGYVDTRSFRVLGLDYLDGGARPDGRPQRIVSTCDQADALADALDDAGVARIHTLIGASYGGMVALAFAERHAERVEQIVVISAPAEPHPMSTGLRSLQRRLVELGLDTGRAEEALAIARGIAMTTYRSVAEFGERFHSAPVAVGDAGASFPVEAYLRHHGETFARDYTPARFLALSLSCDLHRVDAGRIRTPALFVAARGDGIVPLEQMQALARDWAGPCRLVETPTRTGHDAFLAEADVIGPILRNATTTSVLA